VSVSQDCNLLAVDDIVRPFLLILTCSVSVLQSHPLPLLSLTVPNPIKVSVSQNVCALSMRLTTTHILTFCDFILQNHLQLPLLSLTVPNPIKTDAMKRVARTSDATNAAVNVFANLDTEERRVASVRKVSWPCYLVSIVDPNLSISPLCMLNVKLYRKIQFQ